MNLDLAGKHALVCGASQGIGLATAHELAALGADVTLLARSAAALEQGVAALPRIKSAQKHGTIVADMNEHAALRAQVEAVANAGAVHILINNTGGPPSGSAHAASLDTLDAVGLDPLDRDVRDPLGARADNAIIGFDDLDGDAVA